MSKITVDREVLEQALKYAAERVYSRDNDDEIGDAITTLREALKTNSEDVGAIAQPRQDPVAVFELEDSGWEIVCDGDWIKTLPVGTKLYTSPPSREPLTHGDLDLCRQWFGCIQDTNPSYIGRNDCALAAKLYTRLGLPIPKELQGASAHGIKDTP